MSSFSGGDDEVSVPEAAVVVVSVLVTLSLFGYVGWHAATTPTHAAPAVSLLDTQTTGDGQTYLTVEVYNPASTGLESVTVSANCTTASVTFEHLPTDARLRGTLVCPAAIEDPELSIRSWIESQGSRTN